MAIIHRNVKKKEKSNKNKNKKINQIQNNNNNNNNKYVIRILFLIFIVLLSLFNIFREKGWNNIDSNKEFIHSDSLFKQIKEPAIKEWSSDLPNKLNKERIPAIIKNSPVNKWNLLKKWNQSYISSSIVSSQIIKMRDPSIFIHYDKGLELSSYFAPTYNETFMKIKDLFHKIEHEKNNNQSKIGYYFNDNIKKISKKLYNDIYPVDMFIIQDKPTYNIENIDYIEKLIKLWIGGGGGSNGIIANLHYDASHNYFHQIMGKKTFILLPPIVWSKLYVYSRLHPSHRQSKINLSENITIIKKKYPNFFKINESIYKIELNPGDVMYVPPFWFHHVQSFNISLSLNIWSNSKEMNDFQYILQNPFPYLEEFEKYNIIYDNLTNLYWYQYYFKLLLKKIFPFGTDRIDFINIIYESNLINKENSKLNININKYPCSKLNNNNNIKNIKIWKNKMIQYVNNMYKLTFSLIPKAQRIILFSSYIESASVTFIDVKFISIFLRDCIINIE